MDESKNGGPENEATAAPVARAVAVFSSREDVDTLSRAIDAILFAASGTDLVVDVVVNGNRTLAEAIGTIMPTRWPDLADSTVVRLWYVATPDKAHAWNTYVHDLWPPSLTTFFVDGYAMVAASAFSAMEEALNRNPSALAATGMPSMGRSAAHVRSQMLRKGGFHGTLHAMRGSVVERLREMGFRLPIGIYRNDSTLGGVIYLGLDPSRNKRDLRRIEAVPEASWTNSVRHWWSWADWRGQLRRKVRQAQGSLEHLAIHDHFTIRRQAPEALPATALELIDGWAANRPALARKTLLTRPLCWIALRQLRKRQQSKDDPGRAAGARLIAELRGRGQTRLATPGGVTPESS